MPAKYTVMIDTSDNSIKAADACARVAREGDQVTLYSVVPLSAYHSPYHPNYQEAHRAALDRAAACFKECNCQVATKVDVGPDVRDKIEDYCKAANPDILFMGSRGFGELHGALGSVSQHILHHYEQGGIYIVKPAKKGEKEKEKQAATSSEPISAGQHYLLAVDSSEHTQRATKLLAKTVRPQDAITCLAALESPPEYFAATAASEPTMIQFEENKDVDKQRKEAQEKALAVAENAKGCLLATNPALKEAQIQTKIKADTQGVAKTITAYVEDPANKIDAVVMGTRGRGLMKRMLLGSVSNEVLHSVHNKSCLIVH